MATVWPSLLRQTYSPVLPQAAPTRPVFPVLFSSWPFSFAALADRCNRCLNQSSRPCRLLCMAHRTTQSPRRSALTLYSPALTIMLGLYLLDNTDTHTNVISQVLCIL